MGQQAQPIALRGFFWSHGLENIWIWSIQQAQPIAFPDVFSGLTALETLRFEQRTSSANCPQRFFLGSTALETLNLEWNQLSELPSEVFFWAYIFEDFGFELQQAQAIAFRGFFWARGFGDFAIWNGTSSAQLLSEVLSGLTALEIFEFGYRNKLSQLPSKVFSGLTALKTLDLTNGTSSTNYLQMSFLGSRLWRL